MTEHRRFVVVQTAFPGDVVLTLPLVQTLRHRWPDSQVGFVAIPAAAALLSNHPDISEVLVYDKRGIDRGVSGALRFARRLRERQFDAALVPHRSFRSALIVQLAGIPRRVGFSTSAGKFLFSDFVSYDPAAHEVDRNLALLGPFGINSGFLSLPSLYPSADDVAVVDAFLRSWQEKGGKAGRWVAVAPGSVWTTKRWPESHFLALARKVVDAGWNVALVGGKEDRCLCERIQEAAGRGHVLNAAGDLSFLQSAELLRRSDLLVSNDSAPAHVATAMRVPVVSLFGPTVPSFGFAPRGPRDVVVERHDLTCRPCSIHGGTKCPIGTFECMIGITPEQVFREMESILVSPTTH